MVNFPEGFTIDIRQIAATKLRHIQEKLAAKQDQLQHVVDAIEQAGAEAADPEPTIAPAGGKKDQ